MAPSSSSVVIAPFAPSDGPGAASLVVSIQQGEFGVPITLADQPDLADVPAFYLRGAGGFWVAREEGAVVGTIGLLQAGPGEGALRKMFVRADRRGPPHRIAARLLEALLAHARTHGVRRVLLGTRPEMHAAHCFYERAGFRRLDDAALPPTFPRMATDSLFYALDVG